MIENIKSQIIQQAGSNLMELVVTGFNLDSNYRLISSYDPVFMYIESYWDRQTSGSYILPVYTLDGKLASMEFTTLAEAKNYLHNIQDYIVYAGTAYANICNQARACTTEDEVTAINTTIQTFSEFVA